jgi:hypothetical protein
MSVIQCQPSSITRGVTLPYGTATGGTPATALSTSPRASETSLWTQLIDAMLKWKSDPSAFDPADVPSAPILDTAIDYAVDQRDRGFTAPSCGGPSGSGRIAFEWHSMPETLIIEFIDRGIARFSHFNGDRISERGHLVRNPLTRQMENKG